MSSPSDTTRPSDSTDRPDNTGVATGNALPPDPAPGQATSTGVPWRRRRRRGRARPPVSVPSALPTNDVIYLFMRRMRAPLIVVITMFSICTAGLMAMPGVDGYGKPYRLSIFDAFYQMTITLTTVGYSEIPHAFSYPQRMWLSASIYLVVISWAYAIGVFFSVIQDKSFRDAVAAQRFRRRVRAMPGEFFIIAGYGDAGRTVGAELDAHGRRFVVIDSDEDRVQSVVLERLSFDVPAVKGDCAHPAILGTAGLSRDRCAGVLALTSNDEANLAMVMAVTLLRPDLPIYARCTSDRIESQMRYFAPKAVINPDDRFGSYLALAIRRPVNHQLLTWLMDNEHDELPAIHRGLAEGKWIVCAEPEFAEDVVGDLAGSGLDVSVVDPAHGAPDVTDAIGFVAGSHNDTTNIAMAERVRQIDSDIYLVVRQQARVKKALLDAMRIDAVHIGTELVAREVLARVLNPRFWSFVEYAFEQSDGWAADVRDRLVTRCGERTPRREAITIDRENAPAMFAWLQRGSSLLLTDIMRRPDNREEMLPLIALVLVRGGKTRFLPAENTSLAVGDRVLFLGTPNGLADLREAREYLPTVEYLATGRDVPLSWVWAWLSRRRAPRDEPHRGEATGPP